MIPVSFARGIVGCGLECIYVVEAGGIGRGFILKEVPRDSRVIDVGRAIHLMTVELPGERCRDKNSQGNECVSQHRERKKTLKGALVREFNGERGMGTFDVGWRVTRPIFMIYLGTYLSSTPNATES